MAHVEGRVDASGKLIVLLSVGGVAYVVYSILNQATVSGTLSEAASNWVDDVTNTLIPGSWMANGADYIPTINGVEDNLGIPQDLLARLAYQESHWRADIISGATKSSAGAVGMFQMLPQYFPSAGANWVADAQTAGAYLMQQFQTFNDWGLALAAYNDGPTHVSGYLAGTYTLPQETLDYVTQITADVPVASAFASQLNA